MKVRKESYEVNLNEEYERRDARIKYLWDRVR